MVSSVPASLLTDAGDLVVSITATNTGAHPETTVKTVTDTTTPASTTAEITGSGKATVTSTPTGDGGFTLTGERAVEATSSGAAAGLVRDGSWIGGVLAVVLAAF